MDDFDESADRLLEQEVTRKQFLGLAGAAFLGMFGLLRVSEKMLNGHLKGGGLTNSTDGVFGERKYGGDDEPTHVYDHKSAY